MRYLKYLVTGGAGFIGSNLCRELIRQEHNVGIIDNFSTGKSKNMPKEALHLGYNIAEVLEKCTINFDGIFHLGMPSSTPLYDENPFLVGEIARDAIAILEYVKHKKCKLVYASTSNLYLGNNTPWSEDMPIYVKTYYTEARYYLERLTQLYLELYKVKSTGLRFFSVYGPGEESKGPFANVISQMLWAKRKGEFFSIYGTGKQTRDSIFVTDIVDGLILAMDRNIGGTYNLGTGKSNSFNDIASLVGCKVQYIPNPLVNYVDFQIADTWSAETLLGFKAKVSLEEGIERLNNSLTD